MPLAANLWTSLAPALVGAGVASLGLLVGFLQWRKNREVERDKLDVERAKLAWDKEKTQQELVAEESKAEREYLERMLAAREHADSLERRALDYREAVVDTLRRLKILDMSQPLNLESLYVQVRVREEEPPLYVRPDDTRRSREEPHAARPTETHTPEEALARYHRMAVVGDPGAGKTTMLKYLTFRMARGELGPALPVYVELREFVDSGKERLLDYAAEHLLDHRYGFRDAGPYLEERLAAGKAALLLDGLDEVLGGATPEEAARAYTRAAAEISRLADRYRSAPIVVTCRKAGWRGGLTAFSSLEVLDFTWEQVERFVANWFVGDPGKAEGLCAALSGNLRLRALAANPLILSLIAIVYGKDLELPERRAELYSRCIEVMLREWDAHRGVRRYSAFTSERKRDLLEEIAWHFHRHGQRYLPEDELLDVIATYLPTVALEKASPRNVLQEICAQYGLLKVQAHGWYGFLHLTLQEYFAAVAANGRGEDAIREIVRHRHDPWWEEVITLLAGRMADASPLLLAILGRETEPRPGEPAAADDDLFHGDLLLAAACLVGTPRIRMPWLRERILADALALLGRRDVPVVLIEECARTLMEISSPEATSELLTMIEERRHACCTVIEALSQCRVKGIGPRLLELYCREGPMVDLDKHPLGWALSAIKYREAEPRLLARLKECLLHDRQGDLYVHASTLGRLGNREVVHVILDHLRRPSARTVNCELMLPPHTELPVDTAAGEKALRLLEENLYWNAQSTVALMRVAAIGLGPAAAPRLLAVFEREATPMWMANFVGGLEILAEEVLPTLADMMCGDELDRTDRVSVLNGLAAWNKSKPVPHLHAFFLQRLSDEQDTEIKVLTAKVLAGWKDPSGTHELRRAFDAALARSDARACSVLALSLAEVGDRYPVVPLTDWLLREISDERQGESTLPLKDLLEALVPYTPVEVSRAVLHSRRALRLLAHSQPLRQYMAGVCVAELLDKALDVVEEGTSQARNDIAASLGWSRGTAEQVGRFMRINRRLQANEFVTREFRTALLGMSRKSGFRVFADGRIVPTSQRVTDE